VLGVRLHRLLLAALLCLAWSFRQTAADGICGFEKVWNFIGG